jgi:DNA modification methylase
MSDKITVLGKTFDSEDERRTYFREELLKKLPELKKMEGFPIGEDKDILNLSDPPYYTACPNPWLNDFITEWQEEYHDNKNGLTNEDTVVNEPYSLDVEVNKNIPSYNVHTYHTKVPHPAIMRYFIHYTNPSDVILDAFSGTGTAGYAGIQCDIGDPKEKLSIENEFRKRGKEVQWGKRHVISSDISPIATFISSVFNSPFIPLDFVTNANEIISTLKEEIGWMFSTNSSSELNVNYYVYSDFILCNNCGVEHSYFEVAYDEKMKVNDDFKCPSCSNVFEKKKLDKSFETVHDAILHETRSIRKFRPILINYSSSRGRVLSELNDSELEKKKEIEGYDISQFSTEMILGKGKSWGDSWRSGYHKGFEYVHDFYDKSIIIFIHRYLELCEKYDNTAQLTFLLTAILPKLTKLNRYMPQHGSRALVGPMSGTLYLPALYVVNNPIDQLAFQLKKIVKGVNSNSNQLISNSSATKIPLKKESVDYIFTDPPFGSNIMYSELNYFSEFWLKVKTNNKEEAIENKFQNKGIFEYQNLMLDSFQEYFRVLKNGKWMTVIFSNTSAAIWNTIQYSITRSGFVIASVHALNKGKGGLKALIGPTAVNQDLVISCYKPSSDFDKKFEQNQTSDIGVWNFVDEHLHHLPIHLTSGNSTTAIVERSPKILFDRLIAYYVQKGLPVPIDAGKFQHGLRERFVERDGMFFTNEQVQQYDKKKKENPEFIQLSILVSSEQDGVLWLKNLLTDKLLAYQDIQPLWLQALAGVRKGDVLPELAIILEENFLKNDTGKWYAPDSENEADLEKLRSKRLMKQFDGYKEEASKPKGKIKEARVEALREGFKQCYQDKDFKTIVQIGDRIPNNLLMEDEVLLQFYDIASSRV